MMGNTADDVLLSQEQERFQTLDLPAGMVILSSQDSLPIGEGSDLGDRFDKSVFLYAENLVLSGLLSLKNGMISTHQIASVGDAVLSTQGKDGADITTIHIDQASGPKTGKQGNPGGDLELYVEILADNQTFPALRAAGGKGGNGQDGTASTSGGDGAPGGAGGNVQALIVHPDLAGLARLVELYRETNSVAKTTGLQTYLDSIKNVRILSSIAKNLIDALKTSTSNDDLNTALHDASMELEEMAFTWKAKLKIDVSGGSYGVYGGGNPRGNNGTRGRDGTATVIQVGAPIQLVMRTLKPTFFVHPSQCAMVLEKAKLLYYAVDPVANPNGVRDVVLLLKRLKERTDPFADETKIPDLAKFYADHERDFGAVGSVAALQAVNTEAAHLIDQITRGQDIYGYDSQHVPLASFSFYQIILDALIGNFQKIETAYKMQFVGLETQKDTMDQIVAARNQQENLVTSAQQDLKSLADRFVETASLIDGYQTILPFKKIVLIDALNAAAEQLKKYFDFNLESFLSSLSTLAFAPESSMMWITQTGLLGVQGTQDITDDKGSKINKDYLVNHIKVIVGNIESVKEGFAEEQDESLAPDDPGASKLIALESEFSKMMDGFYDKFPTTLNHVKDLFQDYTDAVTARNNQILTYNALVLLATKKQQLIAQGNKKVVTLNDDALKSMKSYWPELTAFVSQMYYASRSSVMETLDLTTRAFRFWSLSDVNLIAMTYGSRTLPTIDSTVLTYAQNVILDSYRKAVEHFGGEATPFPSDPNDTGVVFTLPESQVNLFRKKGEIMVNIPVVRSETSKDNSPFAGLSNVRLVKVRVWIKGATTSDKVLFVNIAHTGKEKIINPDNQVFTFNHGPRYAIFQYNYETGKISKDGEIGWLDEESKSYALVGPFTYWHIQVSFIWNSKLDLSKVTEIQIEFHGTSYGFRTS